MFHFIIQVFYFIIDGFGYWFVQVFGKKLYCFAKQRGRVLKVNLSTDQGIIRPLNGSPDLEFPVWINWRSSWDLGMSEGDIVNFRRYRKQALHIDVYEKIDIYKNWRWCIKCRQYIRYRDSIIEDEARSDWGESPYYYCPYCKNELKDATPQNPFKLHEIHRLYLSHALNGNIKREYGSALNNLEKMPELIKRLTGGVP